MTAREIVAVLMVHRQDFQIGPIPINYEESLSGFVLESLGASKTNDARMPAELVGADVSPAVVHVLTRLRETELTGGTWSDCLLAVRMATLEVINMEKRSGKALDLPWEYL